MNLRNAYWVIFVAAFAVYAVMMVWTLPGITAEAGGLTPFDLRLRGYTPAEAQAFVDALSLRGRALYTGPQRLLDLFYPGLLALVLLGAILTLVTGRGMRATLIVMTFIGMAADYGENYRVGEMLGWDGPLPEELVKAASTLTVTKSTMTGLVMLAVLAAVLLAMWRRWRAR